MPDKTYEEILNTEKIIQNQIVMCKNEISKINSVINNYKNSCLNYLEILKTDFTEEKISNTEEINECNKNIEKYKSIIL